MDESFGQVTAATAGDNGKKFFYKRGYAQQAGCTAMETVNQARVFKNYKIYCPMHAKTLHIGIITLINPMPTIQFSHATQQCEIYYGKMTLLLQCKWSGSDCKPEQSLSWF